MNSTDPRSEAVLMGEAQWTPGQLRNAEPVTLPSEADRSWAVGDESAGGESEPPPAPEPTQQRLDSESPVLTFQFPAGVTDEPPSSAIPATELTPRRRKARRRKERRHAPKAMLAVMVLAAMTTLMFVLLRPDLLFSRSTPTGGDNAVHIWTGDYLKRVLIPHGRLFGWSNDSFAGLPVLSFYFPLPTWLIVGLSYLIPYTIAFKLVTVIGVLLLPWACFRLGRRAELAWPEPLFLAAGTFPFLLLRHYKILGGNLFSTMAGEFSFSLSLLLTVFYMGSLIRLLRTGRGRTRSMALLAGVGLCHIVPSIFAIFFTIACCLFELRRSQWKRQLRDVAAVSVVAGMLTAFWTVPFAHNLPYTNSMDYERNTRTLRTLFPLLPHSATLHTPADGTAQASVFVVLMFVAIWIGLRRRDRFIATMTLTATFSALAFALWPRSAMWNNRLLPSWFFCVYTLGGIGAFHLCAGVWRMLTRRRHHRATSVDSLNGMGTLKPAAAVRRKTETTSVVGPVLLATAIIFSVLGPAFVSKSGHLPFAWAAGNNTGTEHRKEYPEYRNLISVLKTVPCGRLFAEPDSKRYEKYGSTLAMMALPYWTKGCIQTIDGLYFEASQTTPFQYLTANYMSSSASHSQRRLPYGTYNMTTGIDRLRKLGVRYVLLTSVNGKRDARLQPDLRFIVTNGPFDLFEIKNNAIVTPLATQPVVVQGVDGRTLTDFPDVGIAQWVRPADFPSTVAISGPATWQRSPLEHRASTSSGPTSTASVTAPPTTAPPTTTAPTTTTATTASLKPGAKPTTPVVKTTTRPSRKRGDGLAMTAAIGVQTSLPPLVVDHVDVGNQKISFDVDQPGTPVLVRISWFPNWRAHGAKGPYRVAPDFMVVVPTKNHVSLTYEYTKIELASIAVSLIGLSILVLSARRSLKERRLRRTNPKPGH